LVVVVHLAHWYAVAAAVVAHWAAVAVLQLVVVLAHQH